MDWEYLVGAGLWGIPRGLSAFWSPRNGLQAHSSAAPRWFRRSSAFEDVEWLVGLIGL